MFLLWPRPERVFIDVVGRVEQTIASSSMLTIV